MKWAVFLDLDGTFWDHMNVSGTEPPFEKVSQFTIQDRNGVTITIKPGVLDFLDWVRTNGGIISTCSWNKPDMAISALKTLGTDSLFDFHRIDPEPRKDLLIIDLIEELETQGDIVPERNIFYLDDRDLHMTEITKRLPDLNFLHMWKVVRDYSQAREIISDSLGFT